MNRNIIGGLIAVLIVLILRIWWVGTQAEKHAKAITIARSLERGEAPPIPIPAEIEQKMREADYGRQNAEIPKGVQITFIREMWKNTNSTWQSKQSPLVGSYEVYDVAEGRRALVLSGTTHADGTPLRLELPPGDYMVLAKDGEEYSSNHFTVSLNGYAGDVRVVLSSREKKGPSKGTLSF